jgi:hypothetical protein
MGSDPLAKTTWPLLSLLAKCCTEVCPEHIHITDNGIIPLKRVVDEYYDPLMWILRALFGGRQEPNGGTRQPLPMVAPRQEPAKVP